MNIGSPIRNGWRPNLPMRGTAQLAPTMTEANTRQRANPEEVCIDAPERS